VRTELTVFSPAAGVIQIQLDAASKEAAIRQAQADGYQIISARASEKRWTPRRKGSFPLLLFSQELLTLLEAGLNVVEAVEAIAIKEKAAGGISQYSRLRKSLQDGFRLSQALKALDLDIPDLYIAIISASEETGDIAEALRRYISFATRLNEVRSKAISAAIYPVLLVGVGLSVALFLMLYVVPRFSAVYDDLGREMPGVTAALLQLANWLGGSVWTTIMAVVLAISAGVFLLRPQTRGWMLQQAWRVPYVGNLLRTYQLGRFHRTVGMLCQGGIPLVRALETARGLLDQPALANGLAQATNQISEGKPIADSLRQENLVEEIGYRLIGAGERSGEIGKMFEKLADYYDSQSGHAIERAARLLEPALMLLIGLIIGTVVLALYMPIFELASSLD